MTTTSDKVIANLRHLYAQMKAGVIKDTAAAAEGLLGPAIAALEKDALLRVETRNYLAAAAIGSMSRNNSEQLAAELIDRIDGIT